PQKGTHPNVYYVPPFNPPKHGKANNRVLDDPRLPLDYLKYLFGPKVVKVIKFLENELINTQNGEISEVLQLLIGRSGETRYRVVPKTVSETTPTDVKQQVDSIQSGADLTLMGTPTTIGFNSISRTTPCNSDQKNFAECSSCALQSNCDNIG
ncbi:hypothetical protein K8I31_09925, partial [bacterium]|nr:hypothetical protein [bacterium]